jgi:diguanylate cyclase (GGDEF)-like protein
MNYADEIRRQAEAAPRAALPAVTAALWRAYGEGQITETEAEALTVLIEARRSSESEPVSGQSPNSTGTSDAKAELAHHNRVGSPRRAVGSRPRTDASLERRRRWAASGRLPPGLAARFTLAEQAVLALVAAETVRRKDCRLSIENMAAVGGVCRLTGLLNRTRFRECFDEILAGLESCGRHCALLYLDLDRFKTVNDTLGHLAGDALLREVAGRFRSVISDHDMVGRLGGDEFVVLQVSGAGQSAEAAALAERLVGILNRPITIEGDSIEIGVSIGIALAPQDGLDADTLTKRADRALYRAKAEGRNTHRFYEAVMDETAEEKRRLELDLRGALGRGEFEVHYQPIVGAADGRASGAEALVRWRHPKRGLVSPADFIPLAEETGLIVPLGEWVLRTACAEAVGWPDEMRVAVNVSAVQFRHAQVAEMVCSALVSSGLPARRLEIEITESVLMQDGADVTDALHRLRAIGVRTSLDDFGTGYSSLSYLRRFPFHKLKVDRSFIQALADPGTRSIVRAIVSLGHGLGMTVTAEGVETVDQLERVRKEGCNEVQGYLYSKPLPASQFRAFIAAGRGSELAA